MIVLKVTMLEGRTEAQKAELIRRLTGSAAKHLNEDAAGIRILIYEVPTTNWGAGGMTIAERNRQTT